MAHIKPHFNIDRATVAGRQAFEKIARTFISQYILNLNEFENHIGGTDDMSERIQAYRDAFEHALIAELRSLG